MKQDFSEIGLVMYLVNFARLLLDGAEQPKVV
jgi:hypothetical protein